MERCAIAAAIVSASLKPAERCTKFHFSAINGSNLEFVISTFHTSARKLPDPAWHPPDAI
jgi:hypothetical protein